MAKFQPIIYEPLDIDQQAATMTAGIENRGIPRASVTVGNALGNNLAGSQVSDATKIAGGNFTPTSNAKQASAGGYQV